VLSGSEASQAMHEIRTRDPAFDMNLFLRSIKLDAPVVTKAFLKHDMDTLSDHCGADIMQRLEGLCAALKQQVHACVCVCVRLVPSARPAAPKRTTSTTTARGRCC
jgi:hypothetical protein